MNSRISTRIFLQSKMIIDYPLNLIPLRATWLLTHMVAGPVFYNKVHLPLQQSQFEKLSDYPHHCKNRPLFCLFLLFSLRIFCSTEKKENFELQPILLNRSNTCWSKRKLISDNTQYQYTLNLFHIIEFVLLRIIAFVFQIQIFMLLLNTQSVPVVTCVGYYPCWQQHISTMVFVVSIFYFVVFCLQIYWSDSMFILYTTVKWFTNKAARNKWSIVWNSYNNKTFRFPVWMECLRIVSIIFPLTHP